MSLLYTPRDGTITSTTCIIEALEQTYNVFEWIVYRFLSNSLGYGSILIFTEGCTLETYTSVSTRIKVWVMSKQ